MSLKYSFIKLTLIYFLVFGASDFLFGNNILSFLYERNFLVNQEVQLKKVQENEKKYRVENKHFHHIYPYHHTSLSISLVYSSNQYHKLTKKILKQILT